GCPGHCCIFLLVAIQIGDLLVLLLGRLGINIGVDVFLCLRVVRRLFLGSLGLLGVLLGTRGLVGLARASLGRLLGGVLGLLRALHRLRSGIGGLLAVLLLRLPLPEHGVRPFDSSGYVCSHCGPLWLFQRSARYRTERRGGPAPLSP